MPANLYGPGDNYHLKNSHVIPALMRKFHEGKMADAPFVEVWGSGKPLREFLHVDDLADAVMFLMLNYSEEVFVNVGSGTELSIAELAMLIKKVVGFEGEIRYDATKPDGTPRKLMDVSRLKNFGWTYRISLEDGLRQVYQKNFLAESPNVTIKSA